MTDIDKDGERIWNKTEFANNVQTVLENKESHIKMIRVFAELRYEKYTALVDAGFSEKQALEIIIGTGVMG
jgi:hypothetical protein